MFASRHLTMSSVLNGYALAFVSLISVVLHTENTFATSQNAASSQSATVTFSSIPAPSDCLLVPSENPFDAIPASTSLTDSAANLDARIAASVGQFANGTLPDPDDKPVDPDANPLLDSRADGQKIAQQAISRILLGCDNTYAQTVLSDERNEPFLVLGSDSDISFCLRDGDYDFVLIFFLYLLQVAQEHDPSYAYFSQSARDTLLNTFMNTRGKIETSGYRCPTLGLNGRSLDLIEIDDTENHVLMIQISRYLTNQFLFTNPPSGYESSDFDNQLLGNNDWMVNHLAEIVKEHFYEYNSRTYQGITIRAIALLYSYAEDAKVRLAAEVLLDMASAWSALQSNQDRGYPPFRRGEYQQTGLRNNETHRFNLLVGNYVDQPRPSPSGAGFYAAIGKYRMDPAIKDLAIRENQDFNSYLIGRHYVTETYAASKNVLLSAGGTAATASLPKLTLLPTVKSSFMDGVNRFVNSLGSLFVSLFGDTEFGRKTLGKETGFSRPTVMIPTLEPSHDLLDMLRFEGSRDIEQVIVSDNTCVAPGFACGRQLALGNRISGQCETNAETVAAMPGIEFFNLTESNSNCPNYELYMAVYRSPCGEDGCGTDADNYGFIHVVEADQMDYEAFKDQIEIANSWPLTITQTGLNQFVTASGTEIDFEISPTKGQGSIARIGTQTFERNMEEWPRAQGNAVQSYELGRTTIDSQALNRRIILDVTEPLAPKKIISDIPEFSLSNTSGGNEGTTFNDAASLTPSASVAWIALQDNRGDVQGIALGWDNGLSVSYGSIDPTDSSARLDFADGEFVSQVELCLDDEISALTIETNLGNSVEVGAASCSSSTITYTAGELQQIVGFHGKASSGRNARISELGVVTAPL